MSLSATESRVQPDTPRYRSLAAQRLLALLRARAEHAPDDGAVALAVADLCATLMIDRRTLQRAARQLVASGRITVEPPAHRYGPNTYRLVD